MRRLLVTLAAAVAVFAMMPANTAQAIITVKSVTGTGTLAQFGTPTAQLNAISGPLGPLGTFTITYTDGTYVTGTSTCLVVNSKTAYLTGRILLSFGPRRDANNWQGGNYVVLGVQDNGDGTVVPDKLNFSPGTVAYPGCGPNATASPDFFIVKGNYRVNG